MSAFSQNRRRILSLWLPRLPIDRIKRARQNHGGAWAKDISHNTGSRPSPPLWGRAGEGGITNFGVRGLPPSLTKGGGNGTDMPSIVVIKENNALKIHSLDEAAARYGLTVGLPLANARAICPELQVFDADEAADARMLGDIADWCDRFTPLVALDSPHGLFLDITGCAHLFGGEAAMLRLLCNILTV